MSNAVAVLPLLIAPAQVIRGDNALEESTGKLADLGKRPLVVGGDRNLAFLSSPLKNLTPSYHSYAPIVRKIP
jgi:glycerol dehydrogenase